ncbi:FAD/NAD(P)-binding domain-containing protein [Aspergillus ellipticus CBS 707.79]|uniref:FAD/NAD(P)-binding domain-containing protein n=1 Tax=Aspergillus ellipticus CBS 707.79 TaxID=1448320 RepID=A0A319DKQ4_9EURO|nr:FAD/NAD(P)-binding domain-containing protein [Aspergillus ellipticus CBS 707.79]
MSTNVAIIGAGLSGLALALALHQQSIPCTLYEARSAPLNIGGAIMLSPNALRILDQLGVFARIHPEGYSFDNLYFRTPDDQPLDSYEFGNAREYGYQGLRIYRHVLIRELSAMVHSAGIPIHYHHKFSHIVTESPHSVTWAWADSTTTTTTTTTTATATCLVGADGIHSTVRQYLYPDLEPIFTNAVGVTAAVPTSQLQLPIPVSNNYPFPVTILNPTHGAFVIAPQLPDGSEVLIGRQKRAPQLDREGWAALLNNKAWCVDFLRDGADDFPGIVQRAVSEISPDRINLWPFYRVPRLESWSSVQGRVVILGDAAHAIPPTAGQGINQALEDVFTYALVWGRCQKEEGEGGLQRALGIWQRGRQERVDRVLDLNDQIDRRRLPRKEGGGQQGEKMEPFDLEWLYRPDFGQMVEGWFARGL